MREGHNRSGPVLLGIAIVLIVIWVAMRLFVLVGPAWVTGAIAYPELNALDQFRALLPSWLEHVAAERKWSVATTQYLFTAGLVTCAIWVLLAVALTARVRYARTATFIFVGLLLLHSVALHVILPGGHVVDASSLDGPILYVVLAVLLTRRNVASMFQHANA